jgi:hypothetical protein
MARRKTAEDQPLERVLELIDEKVKARGEAVVAELEATDEIARLTSEARRKGASMVELSRRVQRLDKRERTLKPVTRQALDTMLATFEKRREPRTTRASRRRREPAEAAAGINLEALK